MNRRIGRLVASIFVIAVGGCAAVPGGAGAGRSGVVPVVVKPKATEPQEPVRQGYVPGVFNFGFVTEDVWRGGQPTPDGMRVLRQMGVRTIIDLQEADEADIVPAGVRYVPIRCSSWHPERVDTAAVIQAIRDNPKPVFIHCHVGRDRTGMAVAAYRLSAGMKVTDALHELWNFHVNVWFRDAIEARVRELAKSMPPPPAAAAPSPVAANQETNQVSGQAPTESSPSR